MPKRSTKTTATRSKSKDKKAKNSSVTSKRVTRTVTASNNTTVFSSALKTSSTGKVKPASDREASALPMATTSFTQLLITWFSFFLVTVVALYIGTYFFPSFLVFGTDNISPFAGMLQSSALISLLVVGAIPVVEAISNRLNRRMTDPNWMVLCLLINTIGIWVISRFAEMVGMGISSWVVALVLGFVLTLAQGISRMLFVNPLTSRDA